MQLDFQQIADANLCPRNPIAGYSRTNPLIRPSKLLLQINLEIRLYSARARTRFGYTCLLRYFAVQCMHVASIQVTRKLQCRGGEHGAYLVSRDLQKLLASELQLPQLVLTGLNLHQQDFRMPHDDTGATHRVMTHGLECCRLRCCPWI